MSCPRTNAAGEGRRPQRLDWGQVWILYRRELRAAFRERTIVLNSVLIPVFLYPFLLWAAFTGLMFVVGQTEGFESRVVVEPWPTNQPALRNRFQRNEQLQLVQVEPGKDWTNTVRERIRNGQIDAWAEFVPATGAASNLAGNFEARITYDQSRERSAAARDQLSELVERYRADWLKREGRQRGLDAGAWQGFTVTTRNLASKREMGAFLLGLMAPIIFTVMVAVGCFYPAVDALAGERERNTWETLMSTAASRLSLVTAKYLYVATLGGLAGLLNLLAVALTLRPIFAPLLARTGQVIDCSVPLGAIPVAVLAAGLLAGFIAAGMMIFAVFARTFKEGQAMITPFYMLILLPVVFLQAPGLKFSLTLALVPVANLILMVRHALTGSFDWAPMAVTVLVSLILIFLCLRLAAFILKFEDVLVGSYSGSLFKFLRGRARGRRNRST